MSDLPKNDVPTTPEPSKTPKKIKKPVARTAGASTTREDVFKNETPDDSSDASSTDGNDEPKEEKITLLQALREKVKSAKRMSVGLLSSVKQTDRSKKDGPSDK